MRISAFKVLFVHLVVIGAFAQGVPSSGPLEAISAKQSTLHARETGAPKWLAAQETRRPFAPPKSPGQHLSGTLLGERILDIRADHAGPSSSSRGAERGAAPASLVSGIPSSFFLPPVSSPTLFYGDYGFSITVPAGATKLEVRTVTSTPGADIDLYVRYGSDVGLSNGGAVADYYSQGPTGNEDVVATPSSSPPLQPGTYYVAFGLFTMSTSVQGSVTATVTMGSNSTSGVQVLSGNFAFPAVSVSTLLSGGYGLQFVVPPGSASAAVQMNTATPNANVHLYVSYGKDVDLSADGYVIADYSSTADSGSQSVTITPSSSPALRPGVYYIGFGVFTTGTPITGSITVTINANPASDGSVSKLGGAYNLPSVAVSTVFSGDYGFQFNVPAGVSIVDVQIATATPNTDVHLYVRYGQDVDLSADGYVIADYLSNLTGGIQNIVITPSSSPALASGVYYIGFGVFTTGTPISGTVTVTMWK
jgi:hypothetical protein